MIERLGDKQKPCTYCTEYGHTAWKCSKKPRKPMQSNSSFKVHCQHCDSDKHTKGSCPERPSKKDLAKVDAKTGRYPDVTLRRVGKYGERWAATRTKWHRLNKPNHQGYFQCHICRGMVLATEMELDHVISRTRAPELRFELSNLKPSHSKCNRDKGSKNIDEM